MAYLPKHLLFEIGSPHLLSLRLKLTHLQADHILIHSAHQAKMKARLAVEEAQFNKVEETKSQQWPKRHAIGKCLEGLPFKHWIFA